jgi:hypothetical protein
VPAGLPGVGPRDYAVIMTRPEEQVYFTIYDVRAAWAAGVAYGHEHSPDDIKALEERSAQELRKIVAELEAKRSSVANTNEPHSRDYYSKDEWRKALSDVGAPADAFVKAHTLLVEQDIKQLQERKAGFK